MAFDHICDHDADQLADHAVAFHIVEAGAVPVVRFSQDFPQRDAIQHVGRDHAGAQTVIQVVGGVCQFIRHVGDLRFEVAAQVGSKSRASEISYSDSCLTMPSRTSQVRFRPGNSG